MKKLFFIPALLLFPEFLTKTATAAVNNPVSGDIENYVPLLLGLLIASIIIIVVVVIFSGKKKK